MELNRHLPMMLSPSILSAIPNPHRALTAGALPHAAEEAIRAWAAEQSFCLSVVSPLELRRAALACMPALVLIGDAEHSVEEILGVLGALKSDGRLLSVPAIIASERSGAAWLAAGADDVLTPQMPVDELRARLAAAVRRSRRDVQVNPSTRLPGADSIASAIDARLARSETFAACYADLDHFKEFNDRYGYAMGDDIIRFVAALLVEIVTAESGDDGFVGHIGGDDFLFLVPRSDVAVVCDRIIRRADEDLPKRYSAHDRQAGYFFGKDRRGRLDRVPLMTLSIGAVSNEKRRFLSAAQVSELATEMKTYAKTLPGSVWAMDRRTDDDSENPPEEMLQ
jgi:GGDEF domain-containing protein